ncbi:MAG: hypothetical protein HY778_12410, partial [Betaproteobacteria bacterium]|nr:hypothetical protein [Betaproteobacteria bacterium]
MLRWARDKARVRVRILHGAGGAGKSRLAIELAQRLRGEGWEAGLLPDPGQSIAYRRSAQGTLLILDYAEQYPQALERLLGRLKNGEPPDARLRILLLCRSREQMAPLVDAAVPDRHSPALELRPLSQQAIAWALFQAGWADMARRLGRAEASPPIDEAGFAAWLAQDSQHAQPLLVLAYALNLLHDPAAVRLSRDEILAALVDRESARIQAECRAHSLSAEGVLLLKALAALPGRLDAAAVNALGAVLNCPGIVLPPAVALLKTSLWQGEGDSGALPELQPDLLAANLLYRTLERLLPDAATRGEWLWHTLAAGAPGAPEWQRRLSRLARLSVDRPPGRTRQVAGDPLIAALSGTLENHPDPARACLPALERDNLEWPLHPLAVAATRAELARGAATPAEEARLLNILSVHLAEGGERPGGLAAIRRAVEIREKLAAQNFAAYAPDLA